jgi:hypothetical protein
MGVSNRDFVGKTPNSELRTSNSVHLYIEELVLDGFAPGDRHRIADTLENELERLFLIRGVPAGLAESGEVQTMNAGSFEVIPHAKPEVIGSDVAKVIYEGLTGGKVD